MGEVCARAKAKAQIFFQRSERANSIYEIFFLLEKKFQKLISVAKIKEHFCRAKINQVGTYFATVVEGSWTKCESRGYRENFWRAKMYAAQGFFSAAQGERNFVQKGGRNSQGQEHSSSISEPLLKKINLEAFFMHISLQGSGMRDREKLLQKRL